MRNQEFVQRIWDGSITPTLADGSNPIDRLLKPLLPVKTVCLSMDDCKQTMVWSDRDPILPGATMGDLVGEELDINVPYGTMIILHNSKLAHAPLTEVSYAVGRIVGSALIRAALSAKVGTERENEALYTMSVCYSQIVQSEFLRNIGLDVAHFHFGLGSALRSFWIGTDNGAADRSGIFLNPDFLENGSLRTYLRKLDPSFAPPKRELMQSNLILVPNAKALNFEEWQTLIAISAGNVVKEAQKDVEVPHWQSLLTRSLSASVSAQLQ